MACRLPRAHRGELPANRATWSVNGRRGGSKAAGKISQTGLYMAPTTVPRGGTVRIGAAVNGVKDEVVVHIGAVPARRSSPSMGCPTSGPRRTALSCLRTSHHGRRLLVKLVSRRAGTLRVRASHRGHAVGSCSVRAARRRAVTCSMRLPGAHTGGLDVRAALLVHRRVVAVRRGLVP